MGSRACVERIMLGRFRGERGVVLWLPGGGWRGWSDEDGAVLAGHGLRVVPGRYRLSHEATWPAQLADVRAAAVACPPIWASRAGEPATT